MRPGYEHSARTSEPRPRAGMSVGVRLSTVLASSTLSCLACTTGFDIVAERVLPGAGAGASSGAPNDGNEVGGSAGSGGVLSSGAGAPVCADAYPRVLWTAPDGSERAVCTASFARDRMSSALCSCGNAGILGQLRTDGIDSVTQKSASGAAAVGINGEHASAALINVDGSLTIAAPSAVLLAALEVHGDLRLAGALTVAGPLQVARDAWFGGSVAALTIASIGRDVHQPPGKTLNSTTAAAIGGRLISEEFTLAPPCRCGTGEVLDWVNAIDHASKQNDNDSIQLGAAPTRPPAAVDLTLPCGVFYLDELKTIGNIQLRVTGRTALFVAGDVSSLGNLQVELAPDAELDWFVGGKLDLGRAVKVGEPTRPAALRIYVAGAGSWLVPKKAVSANLYAPLSDVVLLGDEDLSGSIFAHTLSSIGDVTVHYDAAVQRAGDACSLAEPPSCTGCAQCGAGHACVAGVCGPCNQDSDCCSPQVCSGGRCVAFLQ